jgi:hypothetical protein
MRAPRLPGNQDRGWDDSGINSSARTLRKLQFLLIADAHGPSAGSTRFLYGRYDYHSDPQRDRKNRFA